MNTSARLQVRGNAAAPLTEHFCRGVGLVNQAILLGSTGRPLEIDHDPKIAMEAYRLTATGEGYRVEASSPGGFLYAGIALGQWRLMEKPGGAPLAVEDGPVFKNRGVMLDISRNKVPTMATLFALADQLATWRINHLQLYTEHTFAYPGHEEIWKDASPMTAGEIRRLDDYCAMLNIELAANQNSLGHLHRWLRHPAYRYLAECPEGYMTPWGEQRSGPFSLNPLDPRSLKLLAEWYDALLPHFSSPRFNVGCDEAFDLGQGASRMTCEARGKGRVYLDYLKQVKRLVAQRGKTMMFWGDIILNYPELVPEVDKDMIALVWGYEADHPFDEQCRRFAEAEVPFWVCPGTSTWNSVTGRFDNAMANIQAAADAGREYHADGFMITEWGDNGHWQTMPFSLLALAAGAAAAWSGRVPGEMELEPMIPDAPTLIELGRVYLDAGFPMPNTSPVFPLLRFKDPITTLEKWTEEPFETALNHLEKAMAKKTIASDTKSASLPDKEIALAAAMLRHALHRGQWLKAGQPAAAATKLADDMDWILPEFTRLWLARNRSGGLAESSEPLELRRWEYRDARAHFK